MIAETNTQSIVIFNQLSDKEKIKLLIDRLEVLYNYIEPYLKEIVDIHNQLELFNGNNNTNNV